MVVMVFGGVLFLPGIVFALFGASMLWSRTGTVTAILGLVLLSLPPLLFAAAGIEEAIGPPRDPYSPSWTARLSLSAALVYALPFVALVLGNAFATGGSGGSGLEGTRVEMEALAAPLRAVGASIHIRSPDPK
ncbi:hypothetical protein IU501_15025 [Nocardia otitidiscaviarum]|uniref:hypothetical protein n=1 Tax=Nocardia otitidiscaviarum TaxID=1823 RepID=UPI0004A719EA|nr:hypothetical protein [Nocardia otitidiscaviarum]MBF6134308.1 hypothetical protein [Nocardia otitidiscaviarum]MBF6484029.1 hypothetical protein [Nocardia otitidiscaviarum]